ncbi:uncharacterized protein EAE97_011503 [Botrytis byssoidea]|uniref:Uncharacterized protein n=1 Tax=Botrytis byssoidea TaxID=139641 RepID=A0A9P5HUZ1_9HELO|nr:uncharacterized protein EAE97_011503 [Botrytis byssoidea]KAF7920162.1 hypothetical protein EAE97_011503 [Botrytis byssoidea]
MWKSVEKTFWIENFTKNAMVFAIGFIPGPGPFMTIAFSLTWTAFKDEEAFWNELSLWVPTLAQGKDLNVEKLNSKPQPVVKVTLDEAKKVLKETEVGEPPEGKKADNPDGGLVLGVAAAEEK